MTSYVNPTTRVGGVEQIVVPERERAAPPDAPYDDEQYVRVNGEWVPYDAPPIIPDTLAPKPPTFLGSTAAMGADGTSVDYTLGWFAPTQNTDNSPLTDLAYYVVRWRYGSSGAYQSATTNSTIFLLPGMKPATNIEWQVLARDKSGNDSTWASNTITGLADSTGPVKPSAPVAASRLGTVTVVWDGLDSTAAPPPSDFHHLDVYMSATTGGPWTLVGTLFGAGAVVVANLEVGVTRFFTTIAVDTSGNSSVRSDEVFDVVAGVTGPDIEANAITANMINSGTMSAAMTITGYLLAGNPTGSRVVIDGQGIRQYDASGNLLTYLPTDPLQASTFEGAVVADSITIKDYMSLQGLANRVARGAVLTLEGGTGAPAAAPSVAISYETYQPPSFASEYLYVPTGGVATADNSDNIIGAKTFFGYGKLTGKSGKWWIGPEYTDSEGNKRTKYGNIGSATAVAVGGVERLIINSVYCTGNGAVKQGRITSLDPAVMNTSGTIEPALKAQLNAKLDDYLFYFKLGRVFGGLTGTQYPERLAVAMVNWNSTAYEANKITLRQYTVTDNVTLNAGFTLVAGSEKVITNPLATGESLIGVTHGRADKLLFPTTTGVLATDFVWLVHGDVKTYAYHGTTMARIPDYDFVTPSGADRMDAYGDIITNAFIGWRTTEWNANGPVTKLTNTHWVTGTSDKWWFSTTNFDNDVTGGQHESTQGPRVSLTMKKRAGLTITAPPFPVRPSPTTTDDPLSARIYIGRGNSDPTRAAMERAGQVDTPNRTLTVGTFTFPGSYVNTPPASGNFPASSPAKLTSETAGWELTGDGKATLAGVAFDPGFPGFASLAMRPLTGSGGVVSNYTGTTFVDHPSGPAITFVAPPSGVVIALLATFIKTNTTAGTQAEAGVALRLGSSRSSGTVISAGTACLDNYNLEWVRGTGWVVFSGLTAGATYTAYPVVKTNNAASAASMSATNLMILPSA